MNKEFITGLLFGFLAPFLILFLVLIIYPVPPMHSGLTLEYAKNNACSILMRDPRGCNNVSTDSILVKDFDANKNGILNDAGGIAWNQNTDCGPSATSGDNLATLCLCFYEAKTDSDCKTGVCGCP